MRWSAGLGACVLIHASTAAAYTYGSPLGDPCHETMVGDALRLARERWPAAAPLPSTGDDVLVIDDLVFDVPPDLRDIGAVTLLIAIRDHDLKGQSGIDTQDLAAIHGDEDSQREHCLRRSEHDFAEGTELAVAECRAFARSLVFAAIDGGMTADGRMDGTKRQGLRVHLAFRRGTTLSVPVFYLRLGQALHTLQDSFSHTFRTPDHRRITVALNWVEQITGELDEARDGPGHMRDLDLCRDLDDLRSARLTVAQEATTALLGAVFDDRLDRAGKKAAVDQILTDYMSYQPGCTLDNGWCNAPERDYADSTCTCTAVGTGEGRVGGWLGPALLTLGLVRRRRR